MTALAIAATPGPRNIAVRPRTLTHPRHASEAQYRDWVLAHLQHPHARWERMRAYRRFVEHWPDLRDWFAEPLPVRVDLVPGPRFGSRRGVSSAATGYLIYLSLVCGTGLDYEYLLARKFARLFSASAGIGGLGVDLALLDRHVDRLVVLGYQRRNAELNVRWGFGRLLLHRGDPNMDAVTDADLLGLGTAIRAFAQRDDFAQLQPLRGGGGPAVGHGVDFARTQLARLHAVHVLLFNTGQVTLPPTQGTKPATSWADRMLPEPCPAAVCAVVERYLRLRLDAAFDRPQTVRLAREALRRFVGWLTATHSDIDTLAAVTRALVEEYLCWLPTCTSKNTGAPLAVTTVKHEINAIAAFFRDTAVWGWDDVPGRVLLTARDSPRKPETIPRYLPRHELDALMTAIEALPDPMQRAALLLVRWSGARRGEIQRLTIDCLDHYPDGHPRLRIPVGKSHTERMIPLHPQAAAALQTAIDTVRQQGAAARHDAAAGRPVRYVFTRRGKPISESYLFDIALRDACAAAGLLDTAGKPTVSAHRFRHILSA